MSNEMKNGRKFLIAVKYASYTYEYICIYYDWIWQMDAR